MVPESFCGDHEIRHILMDHEILLEVFDGPQNIFVILFS